MDQEIAGIQSAVETALAEYIDRVCKGNAALFGQFDNWKAEITRRVQMRLQQLKEKGFQEAPGLTDEACKELQDIWDTMVVTYADKSALDLVLVCKDVYRSLLQHELSTSRVYERLDRPVEEVYSFHAQLAECVEQVPVDSPAHLYGVMKMHKNPVGVRWIAGARMVQVNRNKKVPTTSIAQSSAALGGMLREVMTMLRRKDTQLFREAGVRRYWIVHSAEEVAQQLKCLNATTLGRLWTHDFTAMYTSLPQQAVFQQVVKACEEAFAYAADLAHSSAEEMGMEVIYDYRMKATAKFSNAGQFGLEHVKRLLQAALTGTLIQQSERADVLLQKQGIPMGGKASAEIANIYCYAIEAQMVSEVMKKYGIPAARKFNSIMRFVDDMIGSGEMDWNALPYRMEHKETTQSDGSVVFLGMKVTKLEHQFLLEQQPKGLGWA